MSILAAAKPDFIAFNYYSSATVKASTQNSVEKGGMGDQQISVGEVGVFAGSGNEYLERTEFGWGIDPAGLRVTLRKIYDRYQLPLIITENGLGAFDSLEEGDVVRDDYRIDYLRKHIEQCQLAITDGVKLFGYCPWSAIDLVSTHQGVSKRYGFVYVDRDEFNLRQLRRIRKNSFHWYKNMIFSNGSAL